MAYDHKAYYEANKEKLNAQSREYYYNNKEKAKAYLKDYREANREKAKAYAKVYRKANKEKLKTKKKAWRKANPERDKSSRLKRVYNITLKERNLMLKKQNNKCKICKITFCKIKKFRNDTACIDHCHTTNKVRGILCNMCNKGLGHFKDSTEILTNAINYLEEAA
tara:strand:- start:2070 stop:2567 length:498 start_codon:yes stop_codon:yes gene_type:complete